MKELEGRSLAKAIKAAVRVDAGSYRQQGAIPLLAIIVATDQADAWWYVRALVKAAGACNIETRIVELAADATTELIATELQKLATDPSVHGIILQTPLPSATDIDSLIALIPPVKDVDGANPLSAGRLIYGLEAFAPATAEAVMALLDQYDIALPGRRTVVVGRSRVVGQPVAHLLLARDATVTVCHSRTADLSVHTKEAEVLVVAAGQPDLITPDMVSPEAIIIDVGTNPLEDGSLVGDVAPATAEKVAGLTPVPGGVGPVTTALLLRHVIRAVSLQIKQPA